MRPKWNFILILALFVTLAGMVMFRTGSLGIWHSVVGSELDLHVPGVKIEQDHGTPDVVDVGDQVTLAYHKQIRTDVNSESIRLSDTVVVTIGKKQVPAFVEQALLGMRLHEEKRINLPARFAYGPRYPQLVGTLPKTILPPGVNPEAGMTVTFRDQNGMEIQAELLSVGEDSVVLDMNHPLAGQDIDLLATVVGIWPN